MPRFDYLARSADGHAMQGQLEALSPDALADQLQGRGLIPIRITAVAQQQLSLLDRLRGLRARQRPKATDILFFTRQMYTLTKAGVPMIQGLAGLAESTGNQLLQEAIHEVAQQGADQGAGQTAAKEADDSADDLAPPMARDFERVG